MRRSNIDLVRSAFWLRSTHGHALDPDPLRKFDLSTPVGARVFSPHSGPHPSAGLSGAAAMATRPWTLPLNYRDTPSAEAVLRTILTRNPAASLHEIRGAH